MSDSDSDNDSDCPRAPPAGELFDILHQTRCKKVSDVMLVINHTLTRDEVDLDFVGKAFLQVILGANRHTTNLLPWLKFSPHSAVSSAGIAQTEKDLGVAVRRHPNTHDAPHVDRFHPVLVFTANEYFVVPTEGVPCLFNEPHLHLVHRLLRAHVDECSSLVLSSEGWAKRCAVRGVITVDVGYNSVCGQAWVQRDLCSDPGTLKHNADLDSRVRKMLGRLLAKHGDRVTSTHVQQTWK